MNMRLVTHPNLLANQTVGPVFAEFIVNTFKGQSTGINEYDNRDEIIISLDPGQHQLSIDISQTGENKMSVRIFNINGQMVYNNPFSEESTMLINTSGFPNGAYIIWIIAGRHSFVQKFVITRR